MPCVHRNKFHHSLRNVNTLDRLKAFWSYESVLNNLEEDENNNTASHYPPFFLGGGEDMTWGRMDGHKRGGDKSSWTSLPSSAELSTEGRDSSWLAWELCLSHNGRTGPSSTFPGVTSHAAMTSHCWTWTFGISITHILGWWKAAAQIKCFGTREPWSDLWPRI